MDWATVTILYPVMCWTGLDCLRVLLHSSCVLRQPQLSSTTRKTSSPRRTEWKSPWRACRATWTPLGPAGPSALLCSFFTFFCTYSMPWSLFYTYSYSFLRKRSLFIGQKMHYHYSMTSNFNGIKRHLL